MLPIYKYREKITIPSKQLKQIIKKEWAVFKKKNDIKVSRAAEYNIIHAVSRALKEGGSSLLPLLIKLTITIENVVY